MCTRNALKNPFLVCATKSCHITQRLISAQYRRTYNISRYNRIKVCQSQHQQQLRFFRSFANGPHHQQTQQLYNSDTDNKQNSETESSSTTSLTADDMEVNGEPVDLTATSLFVDGKMGYSRRYSNNYDAIFNKREADKECGLDNESGNRDNKIDNKVNNSNDKKKDINLNQVWKTRVVSFNYVTRSVRMRINSTSNALSKLKRHMMLNNAWTTCSLARKIS